MHTIDEAAAAGRKIPRHIAIILDGNGRWAKKRGLPRALGHKAGCEALERTVEDCARLGVEFLTVYAFSTENWKRSQEEVSALMQLFAFYIPRLRKRAMANDIRVTAIGDESRFAPELARMLDELVRDTAENKGMTLVMALNYGARDELRRAAVRLAAQVQRGELLPEEITEETIAQALDTAGIPDPDLLIRTSGEQRLSNFLLWQSAYTEFLFPEVLWPDFTAETLTACIEAYQKRDRRFGGRKEAGS
ncbi:MAG: isoprenyl transferase [Lachnospiraceae bacterium]|nr:isoprenyl transferase [Lachnospiraceae bacterium]